MALLCIYYFMYLSPIWGCEVFQGKEYVLLIFLLESSSVGYKVAFNKYLN